MKKLILISLIFLGLTSCSKKDDLTEPTQPINWYVGNYIGHPTGDVIYLTYRKDDVEMTYIDLNGLVDGFMWSDSLIYLSTDSVIFFADSVNFLNTVYPVRLVMTNNFVLKVESLSGVQILPDISLSRQ